MKKLKTHIVLAIFLMHFAVLKAQNQLNLNTYMYHQALINPAAMGASDVLTAAMLYKQQWAGFLGAPTTQFFDIHSPIKVSPNILGLTVFNYSEGIHNQTNISASYAFRGKLDQYRYFCLGFSPSLVLLNTDFSLINTDFEGDPLFSSTGVNGYTYNARFGAYYKSRDFYLGASIPQLFYNRILSNDNVETTFDIARISLLANGGYYYRINKDFTFTPSFLFFYQTAEPLRIDLNALFDYKGKFGGGFSYRTLQTVSFVLQLALNDQFKFAYNYNYNFGEISNISNNNHELMLQFGLFNRKVAVVNMPEVLNEYIKKSKKEGAKREERLLKKKSKENNDEQDSEQRQPYMK